MQIQARREAARLSKSEVARRLGVDLSTVCHRESGAANPKADTLPVLADLLGCSIDELYGQEYAASGVPAGTGLEPIPKLAAQNLPCNLHTVNWDKL